MESYLVAGLIGMAIGIFITKIIVTMTKDREHATRCKLCQITKHRHEEEQLHK